MEKWERNLVSLFAFLVSDFFAFMHSLSLTLARKFTSNFYLIELLENGICKSIAVYHIFMATKEIKFQEKCQWMNEKLCL